MGKAVSLKDLGEGGFRVSGGSALDVGTSVSVRIQFPGLNSAIDAAGAVAWSDSSGRAGVRFTRIQPDSSVALRQWLESHPRVPEGGTTANDSVLESRIASLAEVSQLQADICSRQLDRDAALDLIVRRMIELTRAAGAAIALHEGENVVCRASAGNAPDVGVKLSLSSLSGECFRTGAMVLLNDSEADPRVDPAICRQLNFRSLLVLPVTSDAEVVGIAEVLSPSAHNFEGGDVLVLSFLADLIAGIAAPPGQKETNSSDFPGIFDAVAGEAIEASPTVGASPILADIPVEELKIRSSEEPRFDEVPTVRIPLESGIAPKPKKDSVIHATAPAPAAQEALSTGVLDTSRIVPAVAPKTISVPVVSGQTVAGSPRIQSLDGSAPEPRGVSWTLSIAAAVAGLLVSGGLLFISHRHSPVAATVPASTSAASSVSASQPVSNTVSAPEPALVSNPVVRSVKSTTQTSQRSSGSAAGLKSQQIAEAPPEVRVIDGQSAKLVGPSDSAPEAPQIAQLGSSPLNGLSASLVTAKTPNPQLQVVQSQGVTGGKLLKKVMPRYPDEARRAGISGEVVMAATIGTDGMLHNLKVISGSPVLREEAVTAARQWRYIPAMLSGKPVETDTRITISFHHQ